jgi:hypothetical protein
VSEHPSEAVIRAASLSLKRRRRFANEFADLSVLRVYYGVPELDQFPEPLEDLAPFGR